MTWLIFAILTGIAESFKDISSKFGSRTASPLALAWGMFSFSIPGLWIYASFSEMPELQSDFWFWLTLAASFHIVAIQCYMRAVSASDLSLSMPLIMFTPVFVLFTSPLMIDETASSMGILGVLLIVAGSYALNISQFHRGPLEPFKALVREAGPRYMLALAVLYSITSNFDRKGIAAANPGFWAAAVCTAIALGLTLLLLFNEKARMTLRPSVRRLGLLGAVNTAVMIFHMTAISYGLVVYVVAIKRCSVLITILLSRLIYKEGNIKERALGALIMLAGVFVLSLT